MSATGDAFVGRVVELRRLGDNAAPGVCVCVCGTEGVGKTRLVAEFMRRQGRFWPDLSWVDARATPDRVAIGARPRGMRIIDGFDGSGVDPGVVVSLAQSGVAVVVTSREVLGVSGEVAFALAPLPRPFGDARAPAMRLFAERVAESGGALGLDAMADMAALVGLLDGMPLPLELAAARVADLGLPQVLAELQALVEAKTVRGDRVVRRDLVRVTIAWAWAALDPEDARRLVACAMRANSAVSAPDLGPDGELALRRLVRLGVVRRDAARGVLALPPRVGEFARESAG